MMITISSPRYACVSGKYHPHGDMSVYDALVRMAQDFVMSAPLVAGHGNFGSVDDDPAAAMRYTECKLSALARDALLSDINLVSFLPISHYVVSPSDSTFIMGNNTATTGYSRFHSEF